MKTLHQSTVELHPHVRFLIYLGPPICRVYVSFFCRVREHPKQMCRFTQPSCTDLAPRLVFVQLALFFFLASGHILQTLHLAGSAVTFSCPPRPVLHLFVKVQAANRACTLVEGVTTQVRDRLGAKELFCNMRYEKKKVFYTIA